MTTSLRTQSAGRSSFGGWFYRLAHRLPFDWTGLDRRGVLERDKLTSGTHVACGREIVPSGYLGSRMECGPLPAWAQFYRRAARQETVAGNRLARGLAISSQRHP